MNNSAENRNGTLPYEKKLSILQRTREAIARKLAESSEKALNNQPKQFVKTHKKQPDYKRVQSNGDNSMLPTDKLQLIKRSSIQEKLLSNSCKKSYASLGEDSSSSDASESQPQSRYHNRRPEKRHNQGVHLIPSKTNSQQQFQRPNYNNDIDNENPDDDNKESSFSTTSPIHNSQQQFNDRRRNENNHNYNYKKPFHSNASGTSRRYSNQRVDRKREDKNSNMGDENQEFPTSVNHGQESYDRRPNRNYTVLNECKKSPNSDALRSHLKKRDETNSTDGEDTMEANVTMEGVLHARGPLVNKKNESMYYNDRGRMNFIDWSAVRDESKNSSSKKASHSANKKNKNSCITKIPEVLPEANSDFTNFLKNTTTHEVIYKVKGNVGQLKNPIDSPILKIQRMISNNGVTALPITQEIKQMFKEPVESHTNLIEIMDLPIEKLISESHIKSTFDQTSESCIKSTSDQTSESHTKSTSDQTSESHTKSTSDRTPQVTKVNDVTIPSQSQSENKNESPKVVSVNKETKKWEECDDDLFTFQKSKSKRKVSISSADSANSNEDNIPLSRSTSIASIISPDEKTHELITSKPEITPLVNYTYSSSRTASSDEKSCGSNSSSKSIFDRLKKLKVNKKETSNTYMETVNVKEIVKQESLNCSLDSDDTSLNKSEIQKLPISRMTPLECIRKLRLLKSASAKYSLEENNHIDEHANDEECKKEIKTENDEFLMKETSTRYFKKVDSVNLENIVKVNKDHNSYPGIKLKNQPLLTPIHTRYYTSKTANLKEKVLDVNRKEFEVNNGVEKVSKESSVQKEVEQCKVAHSNSENSEQMSQTKDTNTNEDKFSNADTSIHSDKNSSFEKISEEMKKIDFEKCFTGINLLTALQQVDQNLDTVDEVENDIETVIIQDVDVRMKEQKENVILTELNESGEDILLPDSTIKNNYESCSNIDPDEEFDIVNLEGFAPFQLMKQLKNIQEISNNLKSIENIDTYNNNNNNNNNNKLNSLNLNHDVDEDETTTRSTTSGTNMRKFRNGSVKTEESVRRKKMMNVLKSYQKNREPEDEVSAAIQKESDARQNTSSRPLSRHQILEKIKRAKLHLDCKPVIEQSAIRL